MEALTVEFEIGPDQSGNNLNSEERIGQRMRISSGNFVSKRVRWTRLDLNPLSKWIILKVETLWNAHQTTQATLNMLPNGRTSGSHRRYVWSSVYSSCLCNLKKKRTKTDGLNSDSESNSKGKSIQNCDQGTFPQCPKWESSWISLV